MLNTFKEIVNDSSIKLDIDRNDPFQQDNDCLCTDIQTRPSHFIIFFLSVYFQLFYRESLIIIFLKKISVLKQMVFR